MTVLATVGRRMASSPRLVVPAMVSQASRASRGARTGKSESRWGHGVKTGCGADLGLTWPQPAGRARRIDGAFLITPAFAPRSDPDGGC